MRASITFSILALLAAAQAAPPGDSCGRHRARPPHSRPAAPAQSEGVPSLSASSEVASAAPTLPSTSESEGEASATDDITTTVLETDTVTEPLPTAAESEAAESESEAVATTIAEPSVISTPAESPSPSSAEPSVVSTPASESAATIGGELAVPSPSSVSASASTAVSATGAPAPSATATNPGETKVGLGVNGDTGPLSKFVGGNSKLAWYYNWALDSNTDSAGLEYVPMVWGEESVGRVTEAQKKWDAQGVTHVLSFNERTSDPPLPLNVC